MVIAPYKYSYLF